VISQHSTYYRPCRYGWHRHQGELIKLSFKALQSNVRNILDRHNIPPVPVRNGSIGWRHLMTHYKDQPPTCDFFTLETICLQTIYVLFFIELGTRQIHCAGCTEKPGTIWITQQARQLILNLEASNSTLRFLSAKNVSIIYCSLIKIIYIVFWKSMSITTITIALTRYQSTIPRFRTQTWSIWTYPKTQHLGMHHPRLLSATIFFYLKLRILFLYHTPYFLIIERIWLGYQYGLAGTGDTFLIFDHSSWRACARFERVIKIAARTAIHTIWHILYVWRIAKGWS
jgi:hypothetical protein